ncbi:MAG: phosphatase PAP2-related protein [Candidatus Gracilibacteria bacterium]|jgi:membrane-associated phospholipid phosphatase
MFEFFRSVKNRYKVLFKQKYFAVSFLVAVCIFFGGYLVSYYTSGFNDTFVYPSVGDSILDNISTYNLEFLYVWGIYILLAVILIYAFVFVPERGPFILKTYGILLLVRGIFILLTNYGPPAGFFYADGVLPGNYLMQKFLFKNDLFFSGHVAIPFLAALLFRGTNKFIQWFLVIGSLVMGITVLLMHVHYSIDVFAAYFITYGVYAVSNEFFGRLNEKFFGWRGFCCEHGRNEMTIKIEGKK